MFNPFELHPEHQQKMKSHKKAQSIDVVMVKEIVLQHLKKIEKEKIPMWGYNNKHINSFFHKLISDIEDNSEKKT